MPRDRTRRACQEFRFKSRQVLARPAATGLLGEQACFTVAFAPGRLPAPDPEPTTFCRMSESKPKPNGPAADVEVPKAVVNRLSLYLRELQHLMRDGRETTSSGQLGRLLGFSDAQVRKDLAYFGHFGHPGVGYRCEELISAIRRILGTDRDWPVALIGTGNLGSALIGVQGIQPSRLSHQGGL